jgi:F-type H+-transporting ATPase subunit delta
MEKRPNKKTAKREAKHYAQAAFDIARERSEIEDWELMLKQLAEIMKDPELKEMPHDPRLNQDSLRKVMDAVMETLEATHEQRNLVGLLIKDKKLSLLPWVYEGFVQERKRAEGTLDVTVVSAVALTPLQVQNLKDMLKKKFNAKAEPALEIDPEIIGGIKIVIGDKVYDQTVKGQLERMRRHLKDSGPKAP